MNIVDDFLTQTRNVCKTVYCIGDSMLDEYHEVKVDRISPEWPISVMKSIGAKPLQVPGGVANVVYQYKHFNANARLMSLSGPARSGHPIFCALYGDTKGQRPDDGTHCVRRHSMNGHIPIKQRFVENGIQVAPRLDIEEPLYGLTQEALDKTAQEHFEKVKDWLMPDVAILSDYDKGFFSARIDMIDSPRRWMMRFCDEGKMHHDSKTITIVDPKKGIQQWAGCTVFKPNYKEACEMTGETDPIGQVTILMGMLPGSKIVVTRGNDGVTGWDGEKYFEYKPGRKVKAESVVGAGDCFVALLGLALAHGYTLQNAVEIAYRAGEVYVQNRFNRPITPAELSTTKWVQPEDLASRDFKLVFTNGCFDLLHSGHIATLDYAKSKGDKLVVAVNSDHSVEQLKGEGRPINNLEQRIGIVSRLDMVDFVMSFNEDTPLNVIERCKPDVLVKSDQYSMDNTAGSEIVPELCFAPHLEGVSTTNMVNHCRNIRI